MMKKKRIGAILLSVALVVTQLPAVAMAENSAPEDGSIASFAALDSGVAEQTVPVGTAYDDLVLPDTVTAKVYHVTEDTVIPDEDDAEEGNSDTSTASPSDADESVSGNGAGQETDSGKTVTTVTTSEEEIPVTWDSEPAYDGDVAGKYVFTADADGYTLSSGAKLPRIAVSVAAEAAETTEETQPQEPAPCTKTEGCTLADGHEGECVTEPPLADNGLAKQMVSWTFVDGENLSGGELHLPGVNADNQADFDTVVSMLPTQISGTVDGEADPVTVDITGWSCPGYKQDGDDHWPLTGEYIFTAELEAGYACDPAPTVKVLPGGADNLADFGGLTITGGATTQEMDGQIKLSNGDYTISGTWSGTLTGVSDSNKKAVITVPSGVMANVTLQDVTITKVSGTDYACAFAVEANGTANITLSGANTLTSGSYRAGLEVPEHATVTIGGNDADSLTANGVCFGAGVGGSNSSGGNITINGGTVTAISVFGAGIGGGYNLTGGSGGTIKITSGTVKAISTHGAGIGGSSGAGVGGSGGTIIINGGTVKATSDGSAGIGGSGSAPVGGVGGSGGAVTISGQSTSVTATGGQNINDVGSGRNDSNGGSLSVTDGATLEMKGKGTDAADPVYKNCTIIDKNGDSVKYGTNGLPIASPTLSLTAAPAGTMVLPNELTLTATLSGAKPNNSGKTITFTAGGTPHNAVTDGSGTASCTITSLTQGTYTLKASFAGDGDNESVSAEISGYTVSLGAQEALTLNGLDRAYTYGCEAFSLSTSGGSGGGAVSYASSDSSVASVTGNTVTILKAGEFTVTATKAGDSSYAEKSVTSGEVTVSEATPNVSLSATGGSSTNDPIVLTATVSKVETGATPTGTVVFSENGTSLGTVSLNGSGTATYTVSNPAAGSHTYAAEYSGQTGYYTGASMTHTISVGLADQTNFAISDPGVKTYGDSGFTLTTTGGESTGGVSFSVPSGNGVLTVAADGTVKITGAGKVTVTAVKAADSTYNQATATREITVAPRDIADVTVNVTGNRVYTGSQLQPVFEVKDGALAITTGDYTNSYGSNVDAGTGAGSITLTGQRNYTGTKMVPFDIEKRPLTGAVITLESSSYTHTGGEMKPAVTKVVADGITVLPTEYDVGYANNINVGTATVTVTAKAGSNFSGSAKATFEITKSSSPSGGNSSSGGGGQSYTEPEPQSSYMVTGDNISRSVSRSDLKELADTGKSLTLSCDKSSITFNPAALKAILAAVPSTAGNITFAAAPADLSAFPDAAKQIDDHPVYDFTISYNDGNGNLVTVLVNFPAGSAAITLNYTPAAGEVTGSLFMAYVDDKGAVIWLDKSSYDNGRVLAEVPHFSTYGVAYKTPAPVFTDISGHWAKQDIEFVAARGLLKGIGDSLSTGNNLFSPDSTMTRGMFVTALGRLAGVNPDNYKTCSFTDVKADAYYAAYVEWAAQKNIVKGTGDKLFSPDAPVTREQMAVIMVYYAGQMGYSIPTPLTSVNFADNDTISPRATKEVAAMQRAGIVKGRDGNRFAPQENATRAEVSAVLRRFVEVVIDPATASGWTKNDSGHLLYYQSGKALTGWKEIGGKMYYFDENGIMAVNTKVDDYVRPE